MINDDLLAKFDRIQDLPISEEMLGAFMENNLDETEAEMVSHAIDTDLYLMNLSHDISSEFVENINEEYNHCDESVSYVEMPTFYEEDAQSIESLDGETNDLCSLDSDDFVLPNIDDYFPSEDSFDSDFNDEN